MAEQHEHLLGELESSEGQLGAILRTVYDGDESEQFLESLNTRIKVHEKDIERMCNKNYQGFIESVSELLKVKSDAAKLKRLIMETNCVIQDTGKELVKHGEELKMARVVQRNIIATIEALSLCTPVLELFCKLEEQMDSKQYYSALKTLEQLEHTHLPRISGFSFTDMMWNKTPEFGASIEDKSKKEITEFLMNVRATSAQIGEVAMHQTQRYNQLELDQDLMQRLNPIPVTLDKQSSAASVSKSAESHCQEFDDSIDELCAQEFIDFSPVYRCLHINFVLGKRESFEEFYRVQRLGQLRLVIDPQTLVEDKIPMYKKYFFEILGFFVIEDTVLHTTQGLITRTTVDEFWSMAVQQILAVLRRNCKLCSNVYHLLKIKRLVVWFCHALNSYGFQVDKLFEVLLEIREHYDELLMKTWGETFSVIFENDNFTPLTVDTEDQYHGIVELFPYEDISLSRAEFPKSFPFSGFVLQIYKQIKTFIEMCKHYTERLNLSQTAIGECVRKTVNLMLTKTMSSCLTKFIKNPRLPEQQLVQVIINITHLSGCGPDLEKYISNLTRTDSEDGQVSRLYGLSTFKDALQEGEESLLNKFLSQVSLILEGANYDWLSKTPTTDIKPSAYLFDTLDFIKARYATIFTLPNNDMVQRLCVSCLRHLAQRMEKLLLDPDCAFVSMEGIQRFSVDVTACEDFLKECKVPGLKVESVPMFIGLRQVWI